MRLSLAAASLATSVVLLAGCSNSSQGTLPNGASQGATQNVGGGPADFQMLPKVMTREQVSKLHLSVLPPKVLEAMLHRARPSNIVVQKSGTPSMVITDYAGYIWWVSKTGAVTGYTTDCAGAEGGVVDHRGRLIVSCTNSHTINIYNKGNTTGPADVVLNDTTGFYPGDAFEDNNGNIFATNLSGFSCGPSGCQSYHGDIVWWTTGNQSTGSLPSGSYTDPNLLEDFFADVDVHGSVYVDGVTCTLQGIYGCAAEGPELDTVSNVMGAAPSASNDNVYMNWPGGIYTMGNGQISYDDAGNSAVYLYNSLPGTFASTLNPPQSVPNNCTAESAGYDKGDNHVLVGETNCLAAALGKVKSNAWNNISNIDFQVPVGGLFLNSDK